MGFLRKIAGGLLGSKVTGGSSGSAPAQAMPRPAFVPPTRPSQPTAQMQRLAAMRERFGRPAGAAARPAVATPERAVRAVPKPMPQTPADDVAAYSKAWGENTSLQ